MSLPSAPVKALGKEKISKKIKTSLPSAFSWHSAKNPFVECHAPALGNFFLFLASNFFVQPFLSTRNSSLEFGDFFGFLYI